MSRILARVVVAVLLSALAACTTASDPAATEERLDGAIWRHWQPEPSPSQEDGRQVSGPRAVVLALHGFNDYGNAFQDVATFLQERDIAVHAYDQPGFGAQPDRGLWPGTDRLAADLEKAVAELRRIYGRTPLFVLGESMGGAVAIVAATDETPLDIDGLILSAPAVWGGPHMNTLYRVTLWFASTLAPGWTLSPRGLDIWPSDNIDMLRAYSADPMVIKVTRTDAIAGLVDLMDRALEAAPTLDGEVLLLMGEKDEIVPGGAIEDFHGRLEAADATVIRYDEGYHMLLRDLQRARVFADIETWMEAHIGAGRSSRPTGVSRATGRDKNTGDENRT